jgi:hypothetical protein
MIVSLLLAKDLAKFVYNYLVKILPFVFVVFLVVDILLVR